MKMRVISLSVFALFFFCILESGCSGSLSMTAREGTIKVGMAKAEVLTIWGEPESRDILGEEYVNGVQLGTVERWELWRYPRKAWWAAHGVDLVFNKDGILTSIEPLYK